MTRIKMQNTTKDYSIKETFDRYLTAVEASGATKKTISSYYDHFRCLSKHMDVEMPIKDLSKDDLEIPSVFSMNRYFDLIPKNFVNRNVSHDMVK